MAQKTYKDIEAEANRMFGNKPSKEKFEWRRAQQREAGLDTEAKKRGGVAGAYDRNKALVQAAAPILAGLLIPGAQAGLAGAVTGGLFKGLDREGKSGIGLDIGQAARGAISGYGMGKLGGAAGAKLGIGQAGGVLKELPAGTASTTVAPRAASAVMPPGMAAPASAMGAAAPAAAAAPSAAMGAAGQAAGAAARAPGVMGRMLGGAGDMLSGAAKFGRENASWLGPAATAAAGVLGQRSEQALEEQRMAQQQQQFQQTFNVGEEERRRQREQANRLAGLFMPRSA